MRIIILKNNTKLEVTRCRVILLGFMDADATLDDQGLKQLKPNTALTTHLGVKISLKNLHNDLRLAGWHMNKSSFSS